MWYNHAQAEAVFKQDWTQKEHICRESGMTEAQIQELYDLEREIFNSDRRFYEHCEMNDKLLSQMQQQAITETYDAFNWILVLPSETQQRLLQLPAERLQAFYLHRILHYTQHEIAVQFHKSQVAVHYWIRQIAEILESSKMNL